MSDNLTPNHRRKTMARIRSTGNISTEGAFKKLLKQNKLHGWRTHTNNLPGRPDFIFRDKRVAIFVDGCYWHGCNRCGRNLRPQANKLYWSQKIARNKKRDRRVGKELKLAGWIVLRIWEHELKNCRPIVVGKLSRLLRHSTQLTPTRPRSNPRH